MCMKCRIDCVTILLIAIRRIIVQRGTTHYQSYSAVALNYQKLIVLAYKSSCLIKWNPVTFAITDIRRDCGEKKSKVKVTRSKCNCSPLSLPYHNFRAILSHEKLKFNILLMQSPIPRSNFLRLKS